MTAGEIKLTPRALFGYVLFILGLILLGYVTMNAIYLAGGVFEPLKIQVTNPQTGAPWITNPDTQVGLGIITQIGMYALIISVASILMRNGLSVARKEQ